MRNNSFYALVYLVTFAYLCSVLKAQNDEECRSRIEDWYTKEFESLRQQPVQHTGETPPKLQSLLFFLHIPRTGGRTYHQCFLKALYPPSDRCPRSYDVLRFDPSHPECRLLATHDDYSLANRLPMNETSVITNVRDPVDRSLSAYEFATEIAARTLRSATIRNLSRAEAQHVFETVRLRHLKKKGSSRRTETWDVWPWSHLVPFMEKDLWTRFLSEGSFRADNGSYDTPRKVIPFLEFFKHPLVKDLLHNGGTFQVTGLTNYSSYPEANFLRKCALNYEESGLKVLQIAKLRLERMLYVGLTEKHSESVKLFAHIIGQPLSSPAYSMPRSREGRDRNRLASLEEKFRRRTGLKGGLSAQVRQRILRERKSINNKEVSIFKFYSRCVGRHRGQYNAKRDSILRVLSPIVFSKEERQRIPEEILNEIRLGNKLDLELLQFAREIFKKEEELYGKNLSEGEEKEEMELKLQEERKAAFSKQLKEASERSFSDQSLSQEDTETPKPQNGGELHSEEREEISPKNKAEGLKVQLNPELEIHKEMNMSSKSIVEAEDAFKSMRLDPPQKDHAPSSAVVQEKNYYLQPAVESDGGDHFTQFRWVVSVSFTAMFILCLSLPLFCKWRAKQNAKQI